MTFDDITATTYELMFNITTSWMSDFLENAREIEVCSKYLRLTTPTQSVENATI